MRNVDAEAGTFMIGERTITVTEDTLIDDTLIEAARGTEVAEDIRFGDLTETLDELLPAGTVVEVDLDDEGNALSIESV